MSAAARLRLTTLVATVALLLGGCGSGDEEQTEAQTVATPEVSTTNDPESYDASAGEKEASEKTRQRDADDAKRRRSDRDQGAPRPSGKRREGSSAEPGQCPPGLSESECAQVAEIVRKAGSKRVPPERIPCPKGLDRSTCRTIADALERANDERKVGNPRGCPPSLSRDECERIASQLGR